ncbi:30S ribosomal protein S1 [bacterium endosymbiont of Pedicinus badii]|uniref:30S ribosomal protein S1 n=1 Tax=bacterium endosymbiont of Pedicinus badii TaxID=1719126 RepID=UPI0009BBCFDD|nr:30S ribosomal protein S1 [bacterium endosymbiont of Pedicinus badii]OQM34346.1 30S ribosomal protein S1 [bacterium endosymbiont of Pedicinus badii]
MENTKKNFLKVFKKFLKIIDTKPGSIIKGKIIDIKKDIVLVDANLKSESNIPIEQFLDRKGNLEVKVGDIVDVTLDAIEDGFGNTILSREKAKKHEAWLSLEKAHENKNSVIGIINGKVKGGFTAEINGIRAFLPGSLVDIRPIKDSMQLEGKELEFKVIKLDQKRNNVVISRRAVIESENSVERNKILSSLQEGDKIKGIVKNLTEYGAFIDLGGLDGLLHITDMAWKRVKHPNEIVEIGEEIFVKILKFDKEKTRVSLGLKQLEEDPWIDISKKYPSGSKIKGKVTNLTDYGCFVEIQEGVEGLVHISEMDWTKKNLHPSKVVQLGEIKEVMILDIDEEKRRISLGIKQCKPNPWKKFKKKNKIGDKVLGKIKSITDFGIFVGLQGGVDGLIHLSDISWEFRGEDAVKIYKKGEEIQAVVLQVDVERERISLGIKQLTEDPFISYTKKIEKNELISGEIYEVYDQYVLVKIKEGIFGRLNFLEKNKNYNLEKRLKFSLGSKIDCKITAIDKKNRLIILEFYTHQENRNKENKNKEEQKFSNVMTEAFKAATNKKEQ